MLGTVDIWGGRGLFGFRMYVAPDIFLWNFIVTLRFVSVVTGRWLLGRDPRGPGRHRHNNDS